jgi:hypothetical protein
MRRSEEEQETTREKLDELLELVGDLSRHVSSVSSRVRSFEREQRARDDSCVRSLISLEETVGRLEHRMLEGDKWL